MCFALYQYRFLTTDSTNKNNDGKIKSVEFLGHWVQLRSIQLCKNSFLALPVFLEVVGVHTRWPLNSGGGGGSCAGDPWPLGDGYMESENSILIIKFYWASH